MATITHLFLKKDRGLPMTPVTTLSCIAGAGIENNANSGVLTPRQVLITRKEDLDAFHVPYGCLRENIIIKGADPEAFRPGALLRINNAVKIRLTFYCEPCKRIAGVVPHLKDIIHKRGILAVVMAGGTVKINDQIGLLPDYYKPLPESPYERFVQFMETVPAGKVVTYAVICEGIGVGESFCRAIPGYMEKALHIKNIPLHRIVDGYGRTIEQFVPDQTALLMKEKVIMRPAAGRNEVPGVPLAQYLWKGNTGYLKRINIIINPIK